MNKIILSTILFVITSKNVLAADSNISSSNVTSGASFTSWSWGSYFEALAIVCFLLGLLWALVWLLKKYRSSSKFPAASLHIENRIGLGPKKWLVVANWEGEKVLLGVTEERISFLRAKPVKDVHAKTLEDLIRKDSFEDTIKQEINSQKANHQKGTF